MSDVYTLSDFELANYGDDAVRNEVRERVASGYDKADSVLIQDSEGNVFDTVNGIHGEEPEPGPVWGPPAEDEIGNSEPAPPQLANEYVLTESELADFISSDGFRTDLRKKVARLYTEGETVHILDSAGSILDALSGTTSTKPLTEEEREAALEAEAELIRYEEEIKPQVMARLASQARQECKAAIRQQGEEILTLRATIAKLEIAHAKNISDILLAHTMTQTENSKLRAERLANPLDPLRGDTEVDK